MVGQIYSNKELSATKQWCQASVCTVAASLVAQLWNQLIAGRFGPLSCRSGKLMVQVTLFF
jgi:hypothetical protein